MPLGALTWSLHTGKEPTRATAAHHHVLESHCQEHETALITSPCYTWAGLWEAVLGRESLFAPVVLRQPGFLVKTDFKLYFSLAANTPIEK